jgi:putative restriction endonuclease
MAARRWTEIETKRALYLYFQLPFGQLHQHNPEIISLAREVDRTPSSIAMKLANFASLDPKITETGRKGLVGATALDRKIWHEFNNDWTRLVAERESLNGDTTADDKPGSLLREDLMPFSLDRFKGRTEMIVPTPQRLGQNFFRRAVLANYDLTCCVTGVAEPRLLNASHIVPWGVDEINRHNPANGLCLAATFDRAFDRGLMTIRLDGSVHLSSALLENESEKTRTYFGAYEGVKICPARRFDPEPMFLRWHNDNCFVD